MRPAKRRILFRSSSCSMTGADSVTVIFVAPSHCRFSAAPQAAPALSTRQVGELRTGLLSDSGQDVGRREWLAAVAVERNPARVTSPYPADLYT
jgi:hypothetical protein